MGEVRPWKTFEGKDKKFVLDLGADEMPVQRLKEGLSIHKLLGNIRSQSLSVHIGFYVAEEQNPR